MRNFQRDGHAQMQAPKGRVSYEPNALSGDWPREDPKAGFRSFAEHVEGDKLRVRPESFADHYSQARQFFISQTKPEQDHIIAALTFELSKVETPAVVVRMLGQLANIGEDIAPRIAAGLGHTARIEPAPTTVKVRTDLKPSPMLSKAKPTFEGRTVGVLVSEGVDIATLAALRSAVGQAGGLVKVVAAKVGGVTGSDGKPVKADMQLAGGPSVLFDAVALLLSEAGAAALLHEAAANAFVRDAYAHCKVIGHTAGAAKMLARAGVADGKGVMPLNTAEAKPFVGVAKLGRVWTREGEVQAVF